MKLNSFKNGLTLLFAALLLAGCESMSTVDENEAEVADEVVEQSSGETEAAPAEEQISAEELAAQQAREAAEREQAALRETRTFYFDFDESSIKPESRAPLAAHATFLASNPSVKVVLEGHCDERGTKGYNIALGESRAKSVASFLKVNGVSEAQMEIISYGEERPAELGQNEAAWSKNRRVYISYQ
ncbi:MAG: peptidoglycan-associated lipoprotein Pal [Oleiphilus sp.]|nr:MAG: peptidoglycan-associated lipoprotein Pal [Oleiphilus sp.]